jgi:REP element-mobilizing transposase RayT
MEVFNMPRKAREKTKESIFHIMARSISEVDLFKDKDDKLKYLSLVKKYQKLYKFSVYGYCLMDNHVHMIIDANGADISDIMHSINFSYALYFNIIHKRHGHLFQDRFRSEIVDDDNYLLALSAYVHNNPTDIRGYEECPEKYEFSSLSVYLGLRQDPYELVDDGFIMGMFGDNPKKARENYIKLVYACTDEKVIEGIEFTNEGTEYRSARHILVRDININEIIKFIIEKMGVSKMKLHSKHCKGVIEAKALLVFMLRSLCNYKCSSICMVLGNITQGRVSMLSSIGIQLIDEERYRGIVEEFMNCYAA